MITRVIAVLALIISLASLSLHFFGNRQEARRIAFVDTKRLLTGVHFAHSVNKSIEMQDAEWRESVKIMEDSLQVFMDSMSVRYDNASLEEKRKMQAELETRNRQINNYKRHQVQKVREFSDEQMAGVYEKINIFMDEYGQNNGYDIIFGTAQGSILYGSSTPADITHEVLAGLNHRYE